jgi:hypothetical protein
VFVVFCSVVDKVKGSDSRFAFLALASEMFFPLFFTFCRFRLVDQLSPEFYLWVLLTGAPGHWLKHTKKEIIIKKGSLFDYLWINYTIFNAINTI